LYESVFVEELNSGASDMIAKKLSTNTTVGSKRIALAKIPNGTKIRSILEALHARKLEIVRKALTTS
jgi:hypothetical protein